MDLWEAKDVAQMGWPENQKAQRQHDAVDWLIGEVERLMAENDKYKTALVEIMNNQNDFCTTCDENVDTAALALAE